MFKSVCFYRARLLRGGTTQPSMLSWWRSCRDSTWPPILFCPTVSSAWWPCWKAWWTRPATTHPPYSNYRWGREGGVREIEGWSGVLCGEIEGRLLLNSNIFCSMKGKGFVVCCELMQNTTHWSMIKCMIKCLICPGSFVQHQWSPKQHHGRAQQPDCRQGQRTDSNRTQSQLRENKENFSCKFGKKTWLKAGRTCLNVSPIITTVCDKLR